MLFSLSKAMALSMALSLSIMAMLFSLSMAMAKATVANTAANTDKPNIMVPQAPRLTMSREEVPSIPQLAAMAANVTVATLLPATEVRLDLMAIRARDTVATLALNNTDTLSAVIIEESEVQCR